MIDEYINIKSLEVNRREPRRKYMNWTQKKEVVKDINASGLYLLEWYYTKVGSKFIITDESAAIALDWTERKVQMYRLKLEKHGYFKQVITKNTKAIAYNIALGHERWA